VGAAERASKIPSPEAIQNNHLTVCEHHLQARYAHPRNNHYCSGPDELKVRNASERYSRRYSTTTTNAVAAMNAHGLTNQASAARLK